MTLSSRNPRKRVVQNSPTAPDETGEERKERDMIKARCTNCDDLMLIDEPDAYLLCERCETEGSD